VLLSQDSSQVSGGRILAGPRICRGGDLLVAFVGVDIQLFVRIGDYALKIRSRTLFTIAPLLKERPSHSPFYMPLVIEKSICNYFYSNQLLISQLFIPFRLLMKKL
jgi:hypothetical protein